MHAGSQRKVTTSHTRVQILCESVGLRCDHKHSIILRMYGAHKCVTRCFCGRNKVNKGTPCVADVIGNCRCPCAKNKQPCTSSCRCKSCSNTYGIRRAQPTIRQRESYSSQKQPLAVTIFLTNYSLESGDAAAGISESALLPTVAEENNSTFSKYEFIYLMIAWVVVLWQLFQLQKEERVLIVYTLLQPQPTSRCQQLNTCRGSIREVSCFNSLC